MHTASLATIVAVLVTGALKASGVRTSQEELQEELEGSWDANSSYSPFVCPKFCLECCMSENTYFVRESARQDVSSFSCIFPSDDIAVALAEVGRICSAPKVRRSVPNQGKMTCHLTYEEKRDNVAQTFSRCPMKNLVKGYGDFLAGHCNAVSPSSWGQSGIIGAAIDRMYFQVRNSMTGGVCGLKGTEFRTGGLLDGLCAQECQGDLKKSLPCRDCLEQAEADICALLDSDLKAGRLDLFAMAAWAGAVGTLPLVEKLPVPSSKHHSHKKFEIPGWPGRAVAHQTGEDDWPIDLKNGAFMCMMLKLQSLPLEDNLDSPHANHYITDLTEVGLGAQSALAPHSSGDVLSNYLGRYGVYQAPLHFDVPRDELLTDRTLERMVFEAIGAHRLELLHEDGGMEGFNPMAPVLSLAQGTTPLLSSLPDHVSSQARFAVRLEGLFEDLPLRKHMAGWGGNAVFSAAGRLLALQYRGETLTAEQVGKDVGLHKRWEYLKFVFRSSLVSTITSFDHLVCTHILVSETLALATREALPPLHPLRLLLSPHIYKTLDINLKAANNLFPKNMLVHRASPWGDAAFAPEKKGDFGKIWAKVSILKYRTFPELFEAYRNFRVQIPEMPEMPFFEDGLLLYNALRAHVSRFLRIHRESIDNAVERFVARFFELEDPSTAGFWPDHFRTAHSDSAALEDLLTECLFVVTGWHRHVGTVPDFFRDTRFAATAWKEGESEPRPKHAMLMQLLAATTNALLPKIGGNLTKIFEEWEGVSAVPDWAQFSQEMAAVQGSIAERNEKRKSSDLLQFHQMEPQYVEWGVMV